MPSRVHASLAALALAVTACATASKRECAWEAPSAAPRGLCRSVNREDLKAATRHAQAAARMLDALLNADVVLAVDERGTAEAVRLHAARARTATEATAARWGLAIGRTSPRPLDADNAAPGWAEPFVAATAGLKAADVPAVAVDLGGAIGVLVPVRSRTSCLSCHGAQRDLAPGVAQALQAEFREARAAGFKPDEHMGFVWAVGVPEVDDAGAAGDAR